MNGRVTNTSRKKSIGIVLWLAILMCAAIYAEVRHEGKTATEKCELLEKVDYDETAEQNAEVAGTGYRPMRSHRVTILALTEGVEPDMVLNNVCEQRRYVARIIKRLGELGASLIVLDKAFGADSCKPGDPGTMELVGAVENSTTPIVVGVATHAPAGKVRKSCLVISPSMEFGNKISAQGVPSSDPAVTKGLIRMNADLRKIPINWYVYQTDEGVAAKEDPRDDTVETLSYTAASIADRHLKDDVRLKAMRERSQHPFTSFIESKNFSRANPLSLLCSGRDKAEIESLYSVKCAANATPDEDVRGQVVIIGDDVPGKDRHVLFDRDVSGLYLQANYIESLLDDRYLQPVGSGAKLPVGTAGNVVFLVAWFALLYLLFWFVYPEIALVISVLIGAIAWYSAKQLALSKGLYFEVPVHAIGALALVVKYADARGHMVGEMLRHRWPRLAKWGGMKSDGA